jgi:hypothetical protein
VLDELATWAPVHAVRGNNDGPDIEAWGAPERLHLEWAGLSIAMIHDSGPAVGRAHRLRGWFPDAGLVVFGHSHIPMNQVHDSQRIFNPGSPTDRRREPNGTMGLLDIADGQHHRCNHRRCDVTVIRNSGQSAQARSAACAATASLILQPPRCD